MPEREKVIKGLECCVTMPDIYPRCEECPYADAEGTCANLNELHRDALALLKAQEPATVEPKRIELADETKAWLDTMDAVEALGNIADICIDWDGYRTADGLGGLINEIWAYARYCAKKLNEAQEPVKPIFDYDGNDVWRCGNCHCNIFHPSRTDADENEKNYRRFCFHCGRAVKWE